MSNSAAPAKRQGKAGTSDKMLYYAIIVNRVREEIARRRAQPGLRLRLNQAIGSTALSLANFPGHAIGPIPQCYD